MEPEEFFLFFAGSLQWSISQPKYIKSTIIYPIILASVSIPSHLYLGAP